MWCGDAIFDATRFGPGAEFAGASFFHEARFHRAVFEGDVRFTSALFCDLSDFEGAMFLGEASFFRAHFAGDVSFRSGQFAETVWFTATRFRNVEFRARDFLGIAYFDGALFGGQFDFVCANFAKLASFEQITWPTSPRDWHAAFDHAMFRSPVSFRRSGFKALASFAGAGFERGLQIDNLDEDAADQVFRGELAAIEAAVVEDAKDSFEIIDRRSSLHDTDISAANFFAHTEGQARWIDLSVLRKGAPTALLKPRTEAEYTEERSAFRELRLRELEAGCRTLKQAMALASDTAREQALYRFELIARRSQTRTSAPEKALSILYGVVSNYGSSMVRPIVTWAVSVVVFALVFWLWGSWLAPDQCVTTEGLAQALNFSWTNAARPLSALSDQPGESRTIVGVIFRHDVWMDFAARALSTLESLLSVMLVFLFALAVRRRFQMN